MKTGMTRNLRSQPCQIRGESPKANKAVRRARILHTLAKIRNQAKASGRDALSMKDIDAEIQAAHKSRRRKPSEPD
ncbi:MAG: hypothetical protein H8E20_01590 [Verrucomicrobia bacterium]|nr:hypothetical protein [Verrucomicrobiota bacterium]